MEILEKNVAALAKKLGSVTIDDLKKEDFDADAVVAKVTEGMLKSPKAKEESKKQFEAGKFAAFQDVEKRLIKEHELNADDYEDVKEGRLNKILEDIKAKAATEEKPDPADKGKPNEELEKLKQKLESLQKVEQANKEAVKRIKELEKQVAEYPTQLEAEKTAMLLKFQTDSEFEKAITQLRSSLKPEVAELIDKDVLTAKGIGIEAVEGGSFRVVRKGTDGKFQPFNKNATEFYTSADLGEALIKAGIIKEQWKGTGTGAGNAQPPAGGGNSNGMPEGKDLAARGIASADFFSNQ